MSEAIVNMFIVTKQICDSDEVEIVEVVDEIQRDMGFLVAYEAMLEDALQYDVVDHSIKNKSKNRMEVYWRGAFGNSLRYCYQIHVTHAPLD
jgi:hypothetical protein